MSRHKLLTLFDAVWLPVLVLVSITWLYAPWLHHTGVNHLDVISAYEGSGQQFAAYFRAGDILGTLVIMLVIWRARLLQQRRWLGAALLIVAGLAIIDDVFIIGCYHHCDTWAMMSHRIHDIESTLSLFALAIATALDSGRRGTAVSRIFLAAQLVAGVGLASGLIDHRGEIFIQYLYQIAAVIWIATVLQRFMPGRRPALPATAMRSVFASLVFMGGLLNVLLAFHLRAYGHLPGDLSHHEPVWLAEHSVIAGVIMLYVSRHIYKGERRAAIIIAIVLATEIIKYSLLTPSVAPLAFGEVLALALWVGWPAFNRNLGVPQIASRLKSLAILFAGVATALLLFVGIAISGRGGDLVQDSRQLFVNSVHRFHPDRRERYLQYRLTHLRYVSAGLGLSLLAATVWSVFLPSGQTRGSGTLSHTEIVRLLGEYAHSSEDYFKLWPADKRYFTAAGIAGFIAYKKVGSTVFALADPITARPDQPRLLQEFLQFCHERGWAVCFLPVPADSVELYRQAHLNALRIGSSAVIDIPEFVAVTAKGKWWRWQLNRAQRTGLTYEIARPPHSPALLAETAAVSQAWLQRAGHAEQGFALGYYNDAYLQACTLHLLRDGQGGLAAFTNQLPTYHQLRRTTVDLIRFRPGVAGAMPVLIAHLITHLATTTDFGTFDLGFVPLAKVDNIAARIARRLAAGRFSANGLTQFKGKFMPNWQPQYLVYDGDLIDLAALLTRLQKAMKLDN